MKEFMEAFQLYATFSGRAQRKQYWMFYLTYVLISIALMIIDGLLSIGILSLIFALAAIIPSFAIGARRLHDTGRSGWLQLLLIIPLIGPIILLVFFCQDSVEDNEYGPNPKSYLI